MTVTTPSPARGRAPLHPSRDLPRTARRRPPARRTAATRTLISDADLNRGRGRLVYRVTLVTMAVLFALIFIFPLYWMITGAVKSPVELAQPTPTLIPQTWHPETYAEAWTKLQIGRFLLNTAFYTVGGWLIQLVVDVAAAYALSKLRPILGKLVLGMMLASLMLPAAALLVPSYLTVVDVPIFGVNLLNTPGRSGSPARPTRSTSTCSRGSSTRSPAS
ncbi:carbohydrate ABC transporter permease [Streptosporangium lutulentum]